ncbi:glutathione S-transferase family protein [Yoonia sp. BS5-3]|uniref:Glutathione S-transferase family protein n=1 Tax=Yoonia phaeophyticola TaxID=3137369 RepID=A0ABZ2VC40_9RHOB
MKLYYSQNSPYARIARVIARELDQIDSIEEVLSRNRKPDNPVLRYSPVGRVPMIVEDDLVITEVGNVVRFLASKSASQVATSVTSDEWTEIMQEGQILGFVEGLAFWVRENRREPEDRSVHLLAVERERAKRCLTYLEGEAQAGHLGEFPSLRFVALAVGLALADHYDLLTGWKHEFPNLAAWFQDKPERISMKQTESI